MFPVAVQVLNRTLRHAGIHGCFRNRERHIDEQPCVERFWYQVGRSESQLLVLVDTGDLIRRCTLGKRRDGVHTGDFHGVVDSCCANIKGTPEQERVTQHVVDLVRIIRPARRNDRVGTCLKGDFRQYLRRRIGQRQDERVARHFLHHLIAQHIGRRQAEEYVRIDDYVIECPQFRPDRVLVLVFIHVFLATDIYDTV